MRRYEGRVKNHLKSCPVPRNGTGRNKVNGKVKGAQLELAPTTPTLEARRPGVLA
jgi:hypothetical protein